MNLLDKASLILTPNAYKAGKLYSAKPTNGIGDLTFSRAGARTRRNSSGAIESLANNVPALEYPVGGGCPAWSFEPQRTKVWKQSNNIASAYYTRIGVVVLDAETIAEDTSTGSHLLLQIDAGVVTGSRYTWSAKIKANGRSRIEIRDNASGGGSCFIDLSNGTKWSPDYIGVSRITPDTDGYYFIEFSFTATSTANYNIHIRLKNASSADSYTGDGVSGIKIKDIGFEEGAYATSFLQTTTASVTRIADAASVTGISSLIGQTEGIWYTEFTTGPVVPSNGDIIGINTGVVNNIFFGVLSGNLRVYIYYNTSFIFFNIPISANTIYKCAIRYKSGDSKLYVNGTPYSNTTAFAFTASLDGLVFLDNAIAGPRFVSNYGTNMFFPAPSDAELQTLTN